MYAFNNREPDSLTKKKLPFNGIYSLHIELFSPLLSHGKLRVAFFGRGVVVVWLISTTCCWAKRSVMGVLYSEAYGKRNWSFCMFEPLWSLQDCLHFFSLPALECVAVLSPQLKPGILMRRPQRFKTGLSGPLCLYKYHCTLVLKLWCKCGNSI